MGECFLLSSGAEGETGANRDLSNLSEEGEARFKRGNIRYVISDGKLDSNELLNIINVHPASTGEWSGTPRYQAGEYSFTTPETGNYFVTLVAGGGQGAHGATGYTTGTKFLYGQASGGSGGGFRGYITLPAGSYKVIIGDFNSKTKVRADSYLKTAGGAVILQIKGGTSGSVNAYGVPSSAGKAGYVVSTTPPSGVTIGANTIGSNDAHNDGKGSNGKTKTNAQVDGNGKPVLAGGASIYNGYGKGGASNWEVGNAGCFTITYQGATSPASVTYDVSEDNPLTIVDAKGKTSTFYGVNGDDLDGLDDGVYHKFLDDEGTELLKNTIYHQLHEPTSALNGDIWIKTCDNLEVYKKVSGVWEDYNKVWIGSIRIASSGTSLGAFNRSLYDNGFVRTKYIYKYQNGANWLRLYPDNWCEQGGTCTSGTAITFYHVFADNNYSLSCTYSAKTYSGFTPTQTGTWIACGYMKYYY